MLPTIDKDRCTGCGKCMEVCPPQAISIQDDGAFVEEEFCEECGLCAPECAVRAIEIPFPLSPK